MSFELIEHEDWKYQARTAVNAKADVTLAFAIDFTTAGEKLTAKLAGKKILQIPLGESDDIWVDKIVNHLINCNARSINIAGNGIYTLTEKYKKDEEYLQRRLNNYLEKVLILVFEKYPHIEKIVSGGQTGVDLAGAVAGVNLGKEVVVTMPKGYRMRGGNNKDFSQSREKALEKFKMYFNNDLDMNDDSIAPKLKRR